MSPRRKEKRRRLVPAAALAICAHLLALLALGSKVPRAVAPAPVEDRGASVQIILLRPERVRRAPSRAAASPKPTPLSPPPATSARVLITPTPEAPTLSAPAPSPPAPPEAEVSPGSGNLRNALRGMVGCADAAAYRLSREERAACDQRLAAAKPAAVGPRYSAEEAATFNPAKQDSILVRKPHNGCLPHLGDRPSNGAGVATRSGATTTVGLSCSWSFW
jgi:hypothetical protein